MFPFQTFGYPIKRQFGGGGAPIVPLEKYIDFVASLAPSLWYRMDEQSGLVVNNYGTSPLGNGVWTPGGGSLGQTGQLGPNEAYQFDAANSIITGAALAVVQNLPAFTYATLLKFPTAGEGSLGRICGDNERRTLNIASGASPFRLTATVVAGGGNGTATSNVGQGIAASSWLWTITTYDDNDGVRKPKIFIGQSHAAAELTYSSQVAASGTLTVGTGAFTVGNRIALDRTCDGLIDECFVLPYVATLAQLTQLTVVSGL